MRARARASVWRSRSSWSSPPAAARAPTPSPQPACPTEPPTAISAQATLEDAALATVTVSGAVAGEFAFELYGDRRRSPPPTSSRSPAAASTTGIWFHRILAGFVIQAGDPRTRSQTGDFEGLGSGGPGYRFEIEPPAEDLAYDPYSVAMANDTPGPTNGSQFFISLVDLDRRPAQRLLHDLRPGRVRDRCRRRHRRRAGQRPARRRPARARSPSTRSSSPGGGARSVGRRSALKQASKPLCNVKETKPPKVLSKRNRRSILTVLFAQRFTTGRKAMGRLGLG